MSRLVKNWLNRPQQEVEALADIRTYEETDVKVYRSPNSYSQTQPEPDTFIPGVDVEVNNQTFLRRIKARIDLAEDIPDRKADFVGITEFATRLNDKWVFYDKSEVKYEALVVYVRYANKSYEVGLKDVQEQDMD